MERYTLRETDPATVVRVMTVHKAKGLGFDLVILPDLEGTKLDSRREGLAVQRASDRTVEWVFDLPGRIFVDQDPVLKAHVEAGEADACYEALSLLYVAMTRAKRAMYLITKPPGKSASRNFPKLLGETLGVETKTIFVGKLPLVGAWHTGNPAWYMDVAILESKAVVAAEPARLDPTVRQPVMRRPARRPSDGTFGVLPAARMFVLERNTGAAFGSTVHALLAEVEWGGATAVEPFRMAWSAEGAAGVEALACLRAPALAPVWTRPTDRTEVWRERAFEVVLDGVWLTGVFDRVLVERDVTGAASGAWVFDFKTDRPVIVGEEAVILARHAGQLQLYRRVAAVLSGLPEAQVECALVMTATRSLVGVPPVV